MGLGEGEEAVFRCHVFVTLVSTCLDLFSQDETSLDDEVIDPEIAGWVVRNFTSLPRQKASQGPISSSGRCFLARSSRQVQSGMAPT